MTQFKHDMNDIEAVKQLERWRRVNAWRRRRRRRRRRCPRTYTTPWRNCTGAHPRTSKLNDVPTRGA